MKVTLLGTGPPVNPNRFQSSALIEIGSDLLLFDAGGGALHQLLVSGVDLSRLGPYLLLITIMTTSTICTRSSYRRRH